MKGRDIRPKRLGEQRRPDLKRAKPGSAQRDRQQREGKRKQRLRKRERGPGCAIGVLLLALAIYASMRRCPLME